MSIRVLTGDCRDVLPTLPDQSVHCIVTSPPYFGLRDYGVGGQIGLEQIPAAYVAELVAVFRECKRVLRDDGTLWLVIGDSYSGGGGFSPDAPSNRNGSKQTTQGSPEYKGRQPTPGLKPKDLIGIPWMVAFALRADGWYLRSDVIWAKPNPMPENVRDRPTKSHEYLFLLSKRGRYYFDQEAVKEANSGINQSECVKSWRERPRNGEWPAGTGGRMGSVMDGRNIRSVWTVATQPYNGAHFATFPPKLIEPCIKAGCPVGGTVMDPFGGAGTTGLVADRLQRNAILIELNPGYAGMSDGRLREDAGMFAEITHIGAAGS